MLLTALTGWLIYGNILYYKDMQQCANGLKFIMFIMILFGYLSMAECCLSGCLIVVVVPLYFIMLRRHQRPNWMPAPPNFIKNLVKTKFNPEANKA